MSYGELPARTSMAAYYHFNGNSTDASGNGNNGTDASMSYGLSTGKFNQGASFNGSTSNVTANGLITTLASSTTGTISFWVKITPKGSGGYVLFECYKSGFSSYLEMQFDYTSGNHYIWMRLQADGSMKWNCHSPVNSLDAIASTWHNVILTHNGTAPLLYIDGVSLSFTYTVQTDKTKWFKSIITDATNKANVLSLTYQSPFIINGALDEYIIETTKCWTASEVRMFYNQSKGRFAPQ